MLPLPDEPAGGFESESSLLTHAGTPSGVDLLDRGTMAMDEQESGLYIDLASDFTHPAGVLPGSGPAGSSRTAVASREAGLGILARSRLDRRHHACSRIFANLLPLPDPNTASSSCLAVAPGAGPGAGHILGCDGNSRDVLSRVIYGARVSLIVGFASISIGLLIGGTLGLIAGFFRGPFDEVMNVLANSFLAFPYLVLALAVVAFLGNSLFNVTLIIVILAWPLLFRVVRASTIEYSERDYVLAARALGATRWRVVRKLVLPDVVPSAVTYGLGWRRARDRLRGGALLPRTVGARPDVDMGEDDRRGLWKPHTERLAAARARDRHVSHDPRRELHRRPPARAPRRSRGRRL